MSWAGLSQLVRYDVHERNGATALRLAGELDGSSPRVVSLIEQAGNPCPRVVLDLSRVSFLDASGLSLLVLANRRLRDRGGGLVLRRPHPAVRRLLHLCGSEMPLQVEEPTAFVAPAPDAVAICSEAVEAAIRIAKATTGETQLSDSTRALRIVASRGCSLAFLDFFEVVEDEECPCGAAWARGEPVYVPDVTRSRIFKGAPSLDVVRDAGIRSIASILLPGPQGNPAGMLSVHSNRLGEWSREQRRQLRELAGATGRLLAGQAS